jgi:hypothetical protein
MDSCWLFGMASREYVANNGVPMTPPITDAELLEWERLAREATPGPWVCEDYHGDLWWIDCQITTEHTCVADLGDSWGDRKEKQNAAFIVAARSALPRLVEEVKRFRVLSEKMAAYINAREVMERFVYGIRTDPISKMMRDAEQSQGIIVNQEFIRADEAMVAAHDEVLAAWRAMEEKR